MAIVTQKSSLSSMYHTASTKPITKTSFTKSIREKSRLVVVFVESMTVRPNRFAELSAPNANAMSAQKLMPNQSSELLVKFAIDCIERPNA
jgi:hypothetical protein